MKKLFFICILFGSVSCDDIIEVVDITNETVSVLAPKNGTVLNDEGVTFTWEPINEAISYKIQIAVPNFENATQIVTDSLVTNTFFNQILSSGNYEWRVRAENSDYATTYTSTKFSVMAPDPVDISNSTVVITTPEDNTTFSTTDTISFSWETLEGANEYELQIVTPDFDSPVETISDETISITNFSVSNLNQNTYEFRVKATNSGFATGYTEISFTVN